MTALKALSYQSEYDDVLKKVITGREVMLISAATPVTELAALFDANFGPIVGKTLAAMTL